MHSSSSGRRRFREISRDAIAVPREKGTRNVRRGGGGVLNYNFKAIEFLLATCLITSEVDVTDARVDARTVLDNFSINNKQVVLEDCFLAYLSNERRNECRAKNGYSANGD